MIRPVYIGILVIIAGCSNTDSQIVEQKSDKSDSETVAVSEPTEAVTAPTEIEVPDTATIFMLPTGEYHPDEVWNGAANENWYGLFKREDGTSYLGKVQPNIFNSQDPFLDEEDEATGWTVEVEHEDYCVMLLAGSNKFIEGDVQSYPIEHWSVQVLPNEVWEFELGGSAYALSATGNIEDREGWTMITDYTLSMGAPNKENAPVQVLLEIETFDDNMVDIMWVGDLDGDNLPDLILNKASHYNVFNPALYLSTRAEGNDYVKMVAEHRSVGC